MRLTDEQIMQDNKRFANWNANALAELKYCGWNIPHRKSITNDNIRFYAWLCRSAVTMMKEQETVVRCKDCKFRGNTNLCPLAYIEKAEQFTALCTDEWFCGNGKRKEGGELNGQGEGN